MPGYGEHIGEIYSNDSAPDVLESVRVGTFDSVDAGLVSEGRLGEDLVRPSGFDSHFMETVSRNTTAQKGMEYWNPQATQNAQASPSAPPYRAQDPYTTQQANPSVQASPQAEITGGTEGSAAQAVTETTASATEGATEVNGAVDGAASAATTKSGGAAEAAATAAASKPVAGAAEAGASTAMSKVAAAVTRGTDAATMTEAASTNTAAGAVAQAAQSAETASEATVAALDKASGLALVTKKVGPQGVIASSALKSEPVLKTTLGGTTKSATGLINGTLTVAKSQMSANAAIAAGAVSTSAAASATGAVASVVSSIVATIASTVSSVVPMVAVTAVTAVIASVVTILPAAVEDDSSDGTGLVATAQQELAAWGVTNHSGAKYWEAVMGSSFINGDQTQWCSCFVTWCWRHTSGLVEALGDPGGGGSWLWGDWAQTSDKASLIAITSSYRAQPGDIILAGYVGGWGKHVGIVESVNEDGTFITIEGNSGDTVARNGPWAPGVYWSHAVRPKWPAGMAGGGSGAFMDGVDFNMSESAFVKHWGARIDSYYARLFPGSPLYGHGEVFARAAYEAHFDPRFLPAVSGQEQGGGLIESGLNGNYYGWGVHDSGLVPVAYGNGIDNYIYMILGDGEGSHFLGTPLKTHTWEEIDASWATDPNWGEKVKYFMSQI